MLARTALILFTWLLLSPPGYAQLKLRWQFKPGEVFYHEMRQDTDTVINVRDAVQAQKLVQTVICRFKVLDVRGEETVVLERRVEDVVFENASGLPDAERTANLMKGMVFTLTLDLKKRQVTKLEGYEDFFARLAKLDELTAQSMKAMLPPEAIRASIEADFFHTPAGDVAKGGQWVRPFRMPMGPLELADFIGLDTCLSIMQVLYEGLADSKYRPCPLLVKYVEAGWLGRKTNRGFYDYRTDPPTPTR